LAAARKSYLQYIIKRTSDDPTLGFAFWDGQGKVAYQLSTQHRLTLSVMDGHSGLDRTSGTRQFNLNSVVESAYHFTLGSLAWRWSPNERFSVTNRASWIRERSEILNRDRLPIFGGGYGEALWNADGSWTIASNAVLEFGGGARRIRDDGFYNRLLAPPAPPAPLERFRGAGVRSGGYVQQSLSAGTRFQLVFGGRIDRHDINYITSLSPYAAASVGLWPGGRLHLNWGQNAQYPEIGQFFAIAGSTALLPERATHLQAAIEQAIDDRTRVRAEVYQRQDRDLLFRPAFDPRLVDGRVIVPPAYPAWENSVRGRARGFQVFLQRRAANNITGWVSYAYGRSLLRDGITGGEFPSDFDQRHAVRAFASYRVRPTVNLSARWTWGSGLPLPGYYARGAQGLYFISADRNRVRLPDYRRADFRINKAFVRNWGQITLFAEVINFTNRENVRFDGLDGYDVTTQRARPGIESTFPILPSAGVVIDF
jgi:hypothetical protein